ESVRKSPAGLVARKGYSRCQGRGCCSAAPGHWLKPGSWATAFLLRRPIAGTPVMLVDLHFLVTLQQYLRVVRGCALHCLSSQVDGHRGVGPAQALDPLRCNEHLMTEPPIARIRNDVANGPRLVIEEQALDV